MTWLKKAALGAAVGVVACGTGTIGNPGRSSTGAAGSGGVSPSSGETSGGGNVPAPDGGASPSTSCAGTPSPGRGPLRRLNRFEYNNTIHDLLGETTAYADNFPPDEQGGGFSNNADAQVVSHLLAESYASAAAAMATNAVTRLSSLYTCDVATTGENGCAKQFITTFGKRAFRRPLTADEATRFFALYATGRAGATFQDGIGIVIEMMLQSPHFTYRVEPPLLGQPGTSWAPVAPYPMATRLSYFLWGSMPDDALFAAADAGALSTPAQVTAQVQRMMQDNRTHQAVATFHREWLELVNALEAPKAAMMFPSWSPALATALYGESSTFAEQVFWSDGALATLLAAPYTYANQAVAQYYGAPVPMGTAYSKIMLDPTQRAGFLTQGTFLASHAGPDQTSPVRRGKFVREQLLCQTVPPPPNDVVIMPPKYDATSTTRNRFVQHETEPRCKACHAAMDSIGFSFEHYDPVGQWRTMDGPSAVDSSGTLTGTDVNGAFDGAVSLIARLSTSTEVADCVATQWLRFATGRTETDADSCTLQSIEGQFAAGHQDMRTLPMAVATSDAFRYRGTQ
jgi:hypothetical protein